MLSKLVEWLRSILPSDVQFSNGQWVDHPSLADKYICAVHGMGGPAVSVDDRKRRYRITLIGPRDSRELAAAVEAMASAIVVSVIEGGHKCVADGMSVISDVSGPSYTTENRVWYQLELQTIS